MRPKIKPEPEPICFTCCHAIGSEVDTGLDCTLKGIPCIQLCPNYQREAGADMPERFSNVDSESMWNAFKKLPSLSRNERRTMREERN